MKKSSFFFDLPNDLIASRPLDKRSDSRLLVLNIGETAPEHRRFYELKQLLNAGDLLVFNNTKVVPARLFAKKETGGAVEILVERLLSENEVRAQVRASKSPKIGSKILLDELRSIEVIGREEDMFLLRVEEPWTDLMQDFGHMPLPPYIDREDEEADRDSYQTVYASKPGAVAAPTAGLHFDQELLKNMDDLGVNRAEVTLHVGAGTYQPVRVDDIAEHKMHSEWLSVDEQVVEQVKKTKAAGGRVIAVGTTAVRSLETAFNHENNEIEAYAGDTDIFLYPGKEFHVVDALITNFHLPESTLLMLVSAFSGYQEIMAAYQEAVAQRYRFFSYGDAMFLSKNPNAKFDIPVCNIENSDNEK